MAGVGWWVVCGYGGGVCMIILGQSTITYKCHWIEFHRCGGKFDLWPRIWVGVEVSFRLDGRVRRPGVEGISGMDG